MSNIFNYLNYYNTFNTNLQSGFKNQFFELQEFIIKSTINNTICKNSFSYLYKNKSPSPVEGIYELALPFNYSITGLKVEYNNQVFAGEVKDIAKAENIYSDTIASGGQSILAKRDTDGVFKIMMGNIEPEKSINLEIDIIGEMECNKDQYHYFLHKSLFPNLYSGKFHLDIDVNFNKTFTIESLYNDKPLSISHSKDKQSAKIKYHTDKYSNPSIITLSITPKDITQFSTAIEYCSSTNSYALGISYYPEIEKIPAEEINQKSEYIFVLDCSGSMSGSPMDNSKVALNLLLRSMPEKSKFNIYTFGTYFKKLFPKSEQYSNNTLKKATVYISETSANYGGTNLFDPILDILVQPKESEYPRQIFLLTDGEVENKLKLISMIYQYPDCRIFTFGIGLGVDRNLVMGISQATSGSYRFVASDNQIQQSVIELLSLAMEPMLYNFNIKSPGNLEKGFISSTKSLKPVYNNERLLIYCYIDGNKVSIDKDKPSNFIISCEGPRGENLHFPVDIDFRNVNENPNNDLHKLFTIKLSYDNHNHNLVKDLSKKHSVLTKYTAFIVSIESNSPTLETMVTQNINEPKKVEELSDRIHQTSIIMRNNIDNTLYRQERLEDLVVRSEELSAQSMSFRTNSSLLNSSWTNSITRSISNIFSKITNNSVSSTSSGPPNFDGTSNTTTDTKPQKQEEPLIGILMSQNANGSFDKVTISQYIPSIPEQPKELPHILCDVWVTLIVLSTLASKYSNSKDKWNLIATKATKFIKLQLSNSNLSDLYDKLLELSNQSVQ